MAQKGKRPTKQQLEQNKSIRYIGEFIWNFGDIESWINEIFLILFDLERVRFMVLGLVDTRKKIMLISEGLREQGVSTHDKLLKELHDIASFRNVIAHSSFHLAQGGVNVDHVSSQGRYGWRKTNRQDDIADTYLSSEEFERKLSQQKDVISRLQHLYEEATPLPSFSREFTATIEQIIESSPNVVRFARRRPHPKNS